MKKLIYFVMLAATMSLTFSACKGKEKEEPEEEPDMTYVISADHFA